MEDNIEISVVVNTTSLEDSKKEEAAKVEEESQVEDEDQEDKQQKDEQHHRLGDGRHGGLQGAGHQHCDGRDSRARKRSFVMRRREATAR